MEQFKRLKLFLVEVVAELKKTTWPARKEVSGTTLVVIATILASALYLYVVDLGLSRGMGWVLDRLRG